MPSSVAAPATCLGIACTYVLGLYLFGAGPRQLPRIVKRRMASVGAAACLSWLPLAWVLKVGTARAAVHPCWGLGRLAAHMHAVQARTCGARCSMQASWGM